MPRWPSRFSATTWTSSGNWPARCATRLQEVPGVTPPIIDPQERVDELHVVLRPDDLALYGISREFVADFVQTALKGEAVSKVLEGQRRFDLVIKLQEPYRSDPDYLKELRLELPDGRGQLRLKDVADFPPAASGPEPGQPGKRPPKASRPLQRHRPRPGERDRRDRANASKQRVQLPEGYFLEFGGQFEAQRSATRLIVSLAGVSHRRHLRRADDAVSVGPDHVSDSQCHSGSVHRRRAGAGAHADKRSRWPASSGSCRWAASPCATASCW